MAAPPAPLLGASLQDLADGSERVAVVFPDLTRPMPNRTVLPPLLAELARAGVPDDPSRCSAPPGRTGRRPRRKWRSSSVPRSSARYTIVDHDGTERRARRVGSVDGRPVLFAARVRRGRPAHRHRLRRAPLLRRLQRGAQGGLPGAGGQHDDSGGAPSAPHCRCPRHLRTREGNPVHDFVRAAAALAPPHLSLDVAINRARQVTAVFAGPLPGGPRCRLRPRAVRRRARRRSALRPRRVDQRGLPPRPQPVPGRQGHGGGRAHCAPGRDHRHGGGLRGRHARRRRLRPPAGRGPHPGRSRSAHPVCPNWTAGRPRCSGACLARAEVLLFAEGLDGDAPGARALLRWRPTSTARSSRLLGRARARGPGGRHARRPADGGDGGPVAADGSPTPWTDSPLAVCPRGRYRQRTLEAAAPLSGAAHS